MNQAETETVAEEFSAHGWKILSFRETADVYFVNTCTVTGRADRSSRQLIHRARRQNGDAIVVAAGCFATGAAEELAQSGEVDLVLGMHEKLRPFDFLPHDGRPASPLVRVSGAELVLRPAIGSLISGRSRAFLKVQDGCDHSCTYCAVTIVRGRSRSVHPAQVQDALKRIVDAGFEEVVLTGVDLSAWGRDLDCEPGDFVDLVEAAAAAGLPRVRLSSLEPWLLTPEIVARLTEIDAWCEHLHLSLQSADTEVLEQMNRFFDLGILRESLAELLTRRPSATIGADLIAGFPGESEEALEKTLRFIKDGPLHYTHVFPFSPRPGTIATKLPNRIHSLTIKQRAGLLRDAGNRSRIDHLASAIGSEAELLVEGDGKTGYTRSFLRTRLRNRDAPPRQRIIVALTELNAEKGYLYAETKA